MTRACYQSILDRDAVATIPPRRNAHLREIRRLGRYEWRITSGCTRLIGDS